MAALLVDQTTIESYAWGANEPAKTTGTGNDHCKVFRRTLMSGNVALVGARYHDVVFGRHGGFFEPIDVEISRTNVFLERSFVRATVARATSWRVGTRAKKVPSLCAFHA